jgi:hypothetical protein
LDAEDRQRVVEALRDSGSSADQHLGELLADAWGRA